MQESHHNRHGDSVHSPPASSASSSRVAFPPSSTAAYFPRIIYSSLSFSALRSDGSQEAPAPSSQAAELAAPPPPPPPPPPLPLPLPLLLAASLSMPRVSSSLGVPNSATRPSRSTSKRSKSATVDRRWAMTRTLQPPAANSRRSDSWMAPSVPQTTADEATTRTTILGRVSSARARHTSCRWPCERLAPPVEMGVERSVKALA